jgi:hypothetical protein
LSQVLTVTEGTGGYQHKQGVLLLRVCFADDGGPFADGNLSGGFLLAGTDTAAIGNPPLVCPGDPRV